MRRISVLACAVMLVTVLPSPAFAGEGGGGTTYQVLQNPGFVQGGIWIAEGSSGYVRSNFASTCNYAQTWAEYAADNINDFYHDRAVSLIEGNDADGEIIWNSRVVDDTGTPGDTWYWIGQDRCLQYVWSQGAPCTDEFRVGVNALRVIIDAATGLVYAYGGTGSTGIPSLDRWACLEVITQDELALAAVNQADLPPPDDVVSPDGRGLTGLDSWFWYETQDGSDLYFDGFQVQIPTTARNWTLDVEVWLKEIRIDADGDGTWDHIEPCSTGGPETVVACAGSIDDPIYEHLYEASGEYPFVIETQWAGTATDPFGTVHVLDSDLLVSRTVRPYTVIEVRSVPVPFSG